MQTECKRWKAILTWRLTPCHNRSTSGQYVKMRKQSGLIFYKYIYIIWNIFTYIYTHKHAHKLTPNGCTVLNEHSTSVGTPYDPNQALQTILRDVNIIGKPRRSRAFPSEFIRKGRHWEIQIKAHLKKSAFWTTLQLSSRSHQGGPWWCMWLFPGAGRGMLPSPGLSQPGCQWAPRFPHQGTVTVILFLCPLQPWTLLSLNFWPHKCQD